MSGNSPLLPRATQYGHPSMTDKIKMFFSLGTSLREFLLLDQPINLNSNDYFLRPYSYPHSVDISLQVKQHEEQEAPCF